MNAFGRIKEELEDHRDSINGNTSEIQANFEYMVKLEEKIDKLNERLDEMQIILSKLADRKAILKREKIEIKPLALREQELFLVLYTSKDADFLTYKDLARKLGLTESLVSEYMANLIEKGIPIIKKYVNDMVYLQLEPKFRQIQARQNLIKLNPVLSRQLSTDLLSQG